MAKKFTAQVDDLILKYENRMIALARQATQETINEAQTPVAKGGHMRVDTGFLRASGQLSLTGVPSGPGRGESKEKIFYDSGTSEVSIAELAGYKLGMSIFWGWTANYAKYRETYDGFLSSALQNWQKTVDRVTNEIKARIR